MHWPLYKSCWSLLLMNNKTEKCRNNLGGKKKAVSHTHAAAGLFCYYFPKTSKSDTVNLLLILHCK